MGFKYRYFINPAYTGGIYSLIIYWMSTYHKKHHRNLLLTSVNQDQLYQESPEEQPRCKQEEDYQSIGDLCDMESRNLKIHSNTQKERNSKKKTRNRSSRGRKDEKSREKSFT